MQLCFLLLVSSLVKKVGINSLLVSSLVDESGRTSLPPDGWLSNDPFREILLRMTRKPRPHQFIGLMGKRSMANPQITRKRHKVNSFVGLMGKRSQEEPESYEWSTRQMYDKRR
ncbi:protachykinin-1 isoform X2 [Xiphias gladius]|uniref:protachykinin-1 isoform X2 n=1 Tax=Xiphias gladius TaxID=8245 RepID=UPI001A99F5B1|nr:protachykinin-1 isoform X2 [Xiphias gladius]